VHERLRQVAPQLPLVDVVLLRVQRRWPAGGPVALEPVRRGDWVAARVPRLGLGLTVRNADAERFRVA
jgi:hypothetical protein